MGFAGIGIGVILLSSCTANFCSEADLASIAYPYEQGVTVYLGQTEFENLLNGTTDPDHGMTKAVIAQEMAWSDEAAALGLPRIAGKAFEGNDTVYKYIPYECANNAKTEGEYNYDATVFAKFTSNKAAGLMSTIIKSVTDSKFRLPSVYYFGMVDDIVLKDATAAAFQVTDFANIPADKIASIQVGSEANLTSWAVNPYDKVDPAPSDIQNDLVKEIGPEQSILRGFGRLKFAGTDENGKAKMWANFDATRNKIMKMAVESGFSQLGQYQVAGDDFQRVYVNQVNSKVNNIRSCIATRDGYFGHYGTASDWRVPMEKKDWGYAWSKGFLEGLLVYPVSWLLDTFAYGMDPGLSGRGQIWALIFVTLIVRGLLILISFKSQTDNQKMQAIQPELAKIQAKYPNSNTNPTERQRLSQEQMALYRRHNIHPMRQLLILIVQFPVFICVWSGLQGASTLATGEVLNMSLSDTIQSILFNVDGLPSNLHGWWTALFLFILMATTQVFSMLLPRILAKRAAKKVAKTSANPAQDQQNRTMKWVAYGMMIFTIVMGFMLPAAMGVYWLIGGLISCVQTLITQLILSRKKARK